MTTHEDPFATDRQDPPYDGPERPMLDGWLDFHRDTLLGKSEGLSTDQLTTRSCEPSTLTLLGLVRHMAEVEAWFNDNITDGRVPPIYYSDQDPDGDFDNLDDAVPAQDAATYRRSVARSRAFCAKHADLLRERIDGATGD